MIGDLGGVGGGVRCIVQFDDSRKRGGNDLFPQKTSGRFFWGGGLGLCFFLCCNYVPLFHLRLIGYLNGHGSGVGGSELLFVKFHEFLTYVYEKICYIESFNVLYAIENCGVEKQHLWELEGASPLS